MVVLIGPPGAGKSTVGAHLAERWGTTVRDTDADIVTATGRTVADIFVTDGEPAFRRLEEAAVAAALAEHDGVVALGGGAVLSIATRELLRHCSVVFLDVGLSSAAHRVGLDGAGRPLLLGNVRSQMKQILDQRRPIYCEVATWTVGTDSLSPSDVAEKIDELIKERS